MKIEIDAPGLQVLKAELRNGVVFIQMASAVPSHTQIAMLPCALHYIVESAAPNSNKARARTALVDSESLNSSALPSLFVAPESLALRELNSGAALAIRNIRSKSKKPHDATVYAHCVKHLGPRELRVLATLGCDTLLPHLVWGKARGFDLWREPGSDLGRVGDWQSLWCLAPYLTLRKRVGEEATAREWLAYSAKTHWLYGAHDYSAVDPSSASAVDRHRILANLDAGRPYLHESIQTAGFADPTHGARKILDKIMADSESLLLGEGASAALVRITTAVLSGAAPDMEDVNALWATITLADWLALWLTATPMWRDLDTDATRVAGRAWLMQLCDALWAHMTRPGGRFDTRAPHMAGAHTAACLWREARWAAAEKHPHDCPFTSTKAMPWLPPADPESGMMEAHRL